jgi:hypothetical protein
MPAVGDGDDRRWGSATVVVKDYRLPPYLVTGDGHIVS